MTVEYKNISNDTNPYTLPEENPNPSQISKIASLCLSKIISFAKALIPERFSNQLLTSGVVLLIVGIAIAILVPPPLGVVIGGTIAFLGFCLLPPGLYLNCTGEDIKKVKH